MLVLSRNLGERIRILTPAGETIWVMVCEVHRGRVRLGIEAPHDHVISREELIEQGVSGEPTQQH